MAITDYKITSGELEGKGVSELPRFPDLKSPQMQQKFDELPNIIIPKLNGAIDEINDSYASKVYVGQVVQAIGAGDMAKAIYDNNDDGVVDAADNADYADTAGNGLYSYSHALNSGVHYLTCEDGGNNIVFLATADFTAGDTFKVNGSDCTARFPDGSALSDNAFVSGSMVLCFKSGSLLTFGQSAAMPKSGGTFTGDVNAISTNRSTTSLRNCKVTNSTGTAVSTNALVFKRM